MDATPIPKDRHPVSEARVGSGSFGRLWDPVGCHQSWKSRKPSVDRDFAETLGDLNPMAHAVPISEEPETYSQCEQTFGSTKTAFSTFGSLSLISLIAVAFLGVCFIP